MDAATLISTEEFERIDTGEDVVELLRGEPIRVPPATLREMDVCRELFTRLHIVVESLRTAQPEMPVGKTYFKTGYLFSTEPRSWLQPDVSVTHRDQRSDRFYLGAPLMVFEIVSDSDMATHLEGKITAYLATGAAEVWVIYPHNGHVWAYYKSWTARLETEAITSELLPGAAIPLSQIL